MRFQPSYCAFKDAFFGSNPGVCGENASHIGSCINPWLGKQAKSHRVSKALANVDPIASDSTSTNEQIGRGSVPEHLKPKNQ
jgi:hypothetical protein